MLQASVVPLFGVNKVLIITNHLACGFRAGVVLAVTARRRWRQRAAAAVTLTATSCSCFRASPSTTASSSTSSSPPRPVSSSTLCATCASSEVTRRALLQPVDGSTRRTVASRSSRVRWAPSAPRRSFALSITPARMSRIRMRQILRVSRGHLLVTKQCQTPIM